MDRNQTLMVIRQIFLPGGEDGVFSERTVRLSCSHDSRGIVRSVSTFFKLCTLVNKLDPLFVVCIEEIPCSRFVREFELTVPI